MVSLAVAVVAQEVCRGWRVVRRHDGVAVEGVRRRMGSLIDHKLVGRGVYLGLCVRASRNGTARYATPGRNQGSRPLP